MSKLVLKDPANNEPNIQERIDTAVEEMERAVEDCARKTKEFQNSVEQLAIMMASMEQKMRSHGGNLDQISGSLQYQQDLSEKLVGVMGRV